MMRRLGVVVEGSQVRAAVCREFGKPLIVEEVEVAPPAAGEVTVRVAACGICHSDISYMDGAWGGTLPAVYGHEVAGFVSDVGEGVAEVEPGDRVVVTIVRSCGRCYFCTRSMPALCEAAFALDEASPLRTADGVRVEQGLRVAGFAERVTVHASQVVTMPDDIPLECASVLACAVPSGFGAVVNTARVADGESVVVVGAGGVGLNSVQAAAMSGAAPIVAVDVSERRLELATMFGATDTVMAGESDVDEAVRRVTAGRGADSVVVTVGTAAAIEQSVGLARRGGTVVVVGMPASGATIELDAASLAHDGRRILGSKLGSVQPSVDLPRLVELYRTGRLKLDELLSERFRLEDVNGAIAASQRGDGLRNLIVF